MRLFSHYQPNSPLDLSNPHLCLASGAKINLFLHIIGKRHDGYHELQTVFRHLDWHDQLKFWVSEQHFVPRQLLQDHTLPIEIHCEQILTAQPQDNLIVKAAISLLWWLQNNQRLPASLPFIITHLDKHLPTGAGLGGGSSNAASTLMALNQLWQLNLDTPSLIDIGTGIGADVPIFLFGHDAIGESIGERLTPITLPSQQYLLLTPNAHISTAKLFAHPKLRRDLPRLTIPDIKQHKDDYLFTLQPPYHNVFESVVCQCAPVVAQALAYLRTLEAVTASTARMTGSGSCVFLPLPTHPDIHPTLLQNWQKNAPCPSYVVSTLP